MTGTVVRAVTNAGRIGAEIVEAAAAVDKAVQGVVTRNGFMLLTDVKRRAARPRTAPSVAGLGPRLQTGSYNRSINVRFDTQGRKYSASVGSNAPQARRLELGYSAPGQRTLPHPHYGPGLDRIQPRFVRDIEAVLAAAHRASLGSTARRLL